MLKSLGIPEINTHFQLFPPGDQPECMSAARALFLFRPSRAPKSTAASLSPIRTLLERLPPSFERKKSMALFGTVL